MKKLIILLFVLLLVSPGYFGALAQDPQGTEQEPAGSRDFYDSLWNRKTSPKRKAQRKKYKRVAVANSSAASVRVRRKADRQSAAGVRRRPPVNRPPVWQDLPLDSAEPVGLTIWRLRKCPARGRNCFLELFDSHGVGTRYEAVRVNAESDFRVADGVQIAVETPFKGFVYVVHQEVYTNGSLSVPKILFPLQGGGNVVGPGHPLLIPEQTASRGTTVLKLENNQQRDLAAERLRIIITRAPIEGLFGQDRSREIGHEDFSLWESKWSGRLELYDLEGNNEEMMSPTEWLAMKENGDGSKDLTTADLSPQQLYLVERRRDGGVLITLDLPYVR